MHDDQSVRPEAARTDGRAFVARTQNAQSSWRLGPDERELLLVRHGSTRRPQGERVQIGTLQSSNPPLSEDGHRQAEAVAKALARFDLAHVFVTPQHRTHQTAAPLLATMEREHMIIEGFHEIHLGEWEHDFYDRAERETEILRRFAAEQRWDVFPGAETPEIAEARVAGAIRTVAGHYDPGKTSVLFAHAGTIAEICRQATGSDPCAFIGVENGSISRIVIRKNGSLSLQSFNETLHLL